MEALLAFFLAMSVTMALTPPLIRLGARLKVLDQPSPRKVHREPIPRIGGIAIAAGLILPHLFQLPWNRLTTAYVIGAVVIAAAGFWDDRRELDWKLKLAAQVAAVLCVMVIGDVRIAELTHFERFALPGWIAWLLTAGFLVGVTNAINLADGLDGLAGGTSLLAATALCVLAWQIDAGFVLIVGAALAGAVLSFLRFNTHPARVFMGDSGSQLLGFTLGVLAIIVTQSDASAFSTALPLLLLGVPIIDTLSVMTQRMAEGRSPFVADRRHVHHRLLAAGFDHVQAVLGIYALQCVTFVLAWWLRYEPDGVVVTAFAAVAAAVFAVLHFLPRMQSAAARGRASRAPSRISAFIGDLRAPERLPAWLRLGIALVLPAYGVIVAAGAAQIPGDVGAVAAALAAFLALRLTWPDDERFLRVERLALYLAASLLVYVDHRLPHSLAVSVWMDWALFGSLAACILLIWQLEANRRFRITPLDGLILFVALVVPNLPAAGIAVDGLGTAIVKLLALFYGIETLTISQPRRHSLLTAGALVGIGAVLVVTLMSYVIPLS